MKGDEQYILSQSIYAHRTLSRWTISSLLQSNYAHGKQYADTKDYWNTKEMKRIRQSLLSGQRPNECRRCWEQEDVGGYSLRQQTLDNESSVKWAEESNVDAVSGNSNTRPRHVMVTLNNRCNLQCRMCNGVFSSRWEDAYNKSEKVQDWFSKIDPEVSEDFKLKDYRRNKNSHAHSKEVIEFLENEISEVRRLSILGGEPFVQDDHLELLHKCKGYEHNIMLAYNSNLSVATERLQRFMEFWIKFKSISLGVSIDGPPKLNEYIRHGTNTALVEKNIKNLFIWEKEHPNKIQLFTCCTFSSYNMKFISETIKYSTGLGLKFTGNLAETPFFLRPQTLSLADKEEATLKAMWFLENIETELQESFQNHKRWSNPYHKEDQLLRIRKFVASAIQTMNGGDEFRHRSYFESFNNMFDENFVKL